MADDVDLSAPSGVTAAENIAGRLHQVVKPAFGLHGAATLVSSTDPMPVGDSVLTTVVGSTSGAAVVTDADGTVQQYLRGLVKRWAAALGSGTAAAALRVTHASDDPVTSALGGTTGSAVTTDATGSIQQYLRGLVKRWADALGAGTAAAALRVTHASDDPVITVLGAKADAKATATDTTSVSAMSVWKQISASLQTLVNSGITVAGGVTSGTPASPSADYLSTLTLGKPTALTDRSGTITSGGTAQTSSAAAKTDRVALIVANPSATLTLYYNTTAVATVAGAGSIPLPPGAMDTYGPGAVPTGAVSVIGATTGQPYTIKEA
jgi:hypothetical protein